MSLFGLGERLQLDEDNERFKTAAIMIENKANLQMENNNGKRPLDVCRSQRVKDAILKFTERV